MGFWVEHDANVIATLHGKEKVFCNGTEAMS